MKKLLVTLAVFCLLGSGAASAQNILRNLGQRAKNAVEQNVGHKVEKGVNDVLDGNVSKKDKKDKKADEADEQEQVKAPAKAGWTCPECGQEGNTGKFCSECGAKQPGAEANAAWTCPECGKEGNTGKFCDECGAKKPGGEARPPRRSRWNRPMPKVILCPVTKLYSKMILPKSSWENSLPAGT
jgi:membrane protease subunit (stomatin/prohibitin family)